jgi:hypothetical protein
MQRRLLFPWKDASSILSSRRQFDVLRSTVRMMRLMNFELEIPSGFVNVLRFRNPSVGKCLNVSAVYRPSWGEAMKMVTQMILGRESVDE